VDTSLPNLRVIRVFDRLVEHRGKPESISMDVSFENISAKHKVCLKYEKYI
jgi:hypothetical protein